METTRIEGSELRETFAILARSLRQPAPPDQSGAGLRPAFRGLKRAVLWYGAA